MTLTLLLNHNLGFFGGTAIAEVPEVAPAPSTATGFGGGGMLGSEIVPVRFAVKELKPEPLIAEFWAFMPSLERILAPVLAEFFAEFVGLNKIIPLLPTSLIAQTGARSGPLIKQLAEHRHDTELDDLRSRLQDIEDMRFLGLL